MRLKSFIVALRGLGYAIRSQRHLQIHLLAAATAIGLGIYLELPQSEMGLLMITISLVIVSEMINTAIETAIDLTTKKRRMRAMLGKDIAAGAVLLSAINALVIGYLLFYDRLVRLITG